MAVPRALPRPAPTAAVERALDGADDRLRLMVLLAALAGLRAAEVASLPWSAIDGGHLVVTGKGGRQRRIPIRPELADALDGEHARRMAGRAGSGFRWTRGGLTYLFPGQSGRPISAGTVTKTLSSALGAATAHSLRHRYATVLYQHSHDLLGVQRLLGHTSPTTTAVYVDVAESALADMVNGARL